MAAPTEFQTQLFLNNEYVDAKSAETLTVINPYDGKAIPAAIQVAGPEDVDLAVQYARAAFTTGPWSKYTGFQRAACMNKFADLIEKHAGEIAKLDTICMGQPVSVTTHGAIPEVVKCYRYYAGWADKIEGESFAAEDGTYRIVQHSPLGVCAGIAPWNFPIIYVGWKCAPALAAGNTFIFKSSEKSPLSALFLGNLVKEAGFPPGVLQFISGDGKVGSLLASHMKIDKISFTGSTSTGKIVQRSALNSNMKRCTLELGGKSPALVFADAGIANAVGSTADGFLSNAGQVCAAASRVFIQESIAPAFIEAMKARFAEASTKLGSNPLDPTTIHGPLADEKQFDRVMSYIDIGKEGAAPIIGGTRSEAKGLFIDPTIFVDPNKDNKAYREEIFGPVLNVKTFKTEEEAIELANDTNTGLSAAIYTSDIGRALRLAGKIESGNVSINTPHFPSYNVPFGGWKDSGSGQELGKYGLQSYLRTKSVHINLKLEAKL
ncbi:putative aldehyde dehydrogenase [Cadophora sp. DSE1049]|nr:putative aldehyde dehydrogenase [Cadophora sp. DSE1049]